MASSPGAEIPSHRACAHCRSQKVRCIPDDNNPDVCQRCARAGRACVFTPLQKRKQRKRTDTRVAELEREMRAMRSMLKKKQESAGARADSSQDDNELRMVRQGEHMSTGEVATGPERPSTREYISSAMFNAESPPDTPESMANAGLPLWPTRWQNRPRGARAPDVVDRGIISMATARQLFTTYREDLFPHYPMVFVPDNVAADEMRETKPALFLAIIAAAAGKDNVDLAATLDQEVLQAYATRSLMHSEKSLELVQALLVSAVWYHPPQKFGQLKYYEYIHMASTMAMDMGMGTRPATQRTRSKRDVVEQNRTGRAITSTTDITTPASGAAGRSRDSSPDSGSLESRRTFLACYMICSSVSVSLRRPNMLRASSYIRECVDFLDRAPDRIPTDRTLTAWVRLMMIADEISTAFAFDDPGGIASIADLSTQLMLRDFRARLTVWEQELPTLITTGALKIMYLTVRLYLHEIAMHVDHSPEDFRAPYQMGIIHADEPAEEIPTQVLADAICECIHSSQALLETFCQMNTNKLRALPVFSFIRVSFGAFVLAKLTLSASDPSRRIGQILVGTRLDAEEHMDRTILHARKVIGNVRCRVPAIFIALLFKLRQWSRHPEQVSRLIAEAAEHPSPEENLPSVMEQRGMQQLEGPRIVEQSSSGENSPRTSDIYQSLFRSDSSNNGTDALWRDIQRANLQSPDGLSRQGMTTAIEGTQGLSKLGVTSDPLYMGDATSYFPGSDPMQLDPELLQLWNEVNGTGLNDFPEGGLTGLDNWGSMPLHMMGLGVAGEEELNWPMSDLQNSFALQPGHQGAGNGGTGAGNDMTFS